MKEVNRKVERVSMLYAVEIGEHNDQFLSLMGFIRTPLLHARGAILIGKDLASMRVCRAPMPILLMKYINIALGSCIDGMMANKQPVRKILWRLVSPESGPFFLAFFLRSSWRTSCEAGKSPWSCFILSVRGAYTIDAANEVTKRIGRISESSRFVRSLQKGRPPVCSDGWNQGFTVSVSDPSSGCV